MTAATGGDSGHDIGLGRAESRRGAQARVPGVCVTPPAASHGVGRISAHGHLMPPAPGKPPPPPSLCTGISTGEAGAPHVRQTAKGWIVPLLPSVLMSIFIDVVVLQLPASCHCHSCQVTMLLSSILSLARVPCLLSGHMKCEPGYQWLVDTSIGSWWYFPTLLLMVFR